MESGVVGFSIISNNLCFLSILTPINAHSVCIRRKLNGCKKRALSMYYRTWDQHGRCSDKRMHQEKIRINLGSKWELQR